MSAPSYDSVEGIPDGTCIALEDEGELHILVTGRPGAWLTARLGDPNVSANTKNNR